jgi:hypothetical protein
MYTYKASVMNTLQHEFPAAWILFSLHVCNTEHPGLDEQSLQCIWTKRWLYDMA